MFQDSWGDSLSAIKGKSTRRLQNKAFYQGHDSDSSLPSMLTIVGGIAKNCESHIDVPAGLPFDLSSSSPFLRPSLKTRYPLFPKGSRTLRLNTINERKKALTVNLIDESYTREGTDSFGLR